MDINFSKLSELNYLFVKKIAFEMSVAHSSEEHHLKSLDMEEVKRCEIRSVSEQCKLYKSAGEI